MNACLCTRGNDRGSISAFVVCLAVTFIAVAGLAVDSGRLVSAHIAVADHAENAARVAAQQVRGLRSGERELDPARARAAAGRYLAQFGLTGDVEVGTTKVEVTARMVGTVTLLRILGIRNRQVSATRRAELIDR